MDLFAMGIVAVLVSILTTILAFVQKRSRSMKLAFALGGLVIGLGIGWLLAPTIVSFY